MRLVLHPKVHADVNAILKYYDRFGGRELADEFYTELRGLMVQAS